MIFIELLFAVYKTSRSREVERNFHQSMFFFIESVLLFIVWWWRWWWRPRLL